MAIRTVRILVPPDPVRKGLWITYDSWYLEKVALVFLTFCRVAVVGHAKLDGSWDPHIEQGLQEARRQLGNEALYRHINLFYPTRNPIQNKLFSWAGTDVLLEEEGFEESGFDEVSIIVHGQS
jgi:hypothetical protein